ncbi:MAG: tripartite tricarboxylate transporter permease [Deltaproteobacteria bacterium]|nr:tripartite tricarboxylate transporter permease [Deltaproteobacteria bacterium]
MVDWPSFFQGLYLIATWKTLVVILLGMWIGLILGVIPGLTGSIGIAIMLPITFLMDPVTALILLTSVYTGGLTGGGITAILINAPGAPGAIATTFDGYPMTKKGYQNEALGLQITSSIIGGFSSYIFLLFFIHPLVRLALKFGPAEMIFLTIFVLILIGTIRGRSFSRTLFIGIFGLLLGTIGTSEATGVIRGAMGFDALEDGIPRIICIIGMFAIPEMLDLITRGFIADVTIAKSQDIRKLFQGVLATFQYIKTLIRSALIGIFIGTLPAAGSTVACLVSYSQAKRAAKPGQHFGEGEREGVVAAETANNASEGGAMAILLALGIPGSGSTAILIAAFMLHGLVPGARLFQDNAPLVYGLISANLIQMILLGFCALLVAFYLARVVFVPTRILAPALMAVMAMGAYSVRNLFFDVYLLFFFGILGWFFRRYDFPSTSFIIGFILGKNLDMDVYRYAALFGSDLMVFIKRPVSAILLILTFITLGVQICRYWKTEGNGNEECA